MENFTNLHYIIGLILTAYGITLGFSNTFYRVGALLSNRTINQNALGYILDTIFYAGVGYLVLVYMGIIL